MTTDRAAWLRHPTRAKMLRAAEERFVADGYDGASVEAIAAAAGVSKSHLYYHFASKAVLFESLVVLRTDELLAAKAAVFDGFDPARASDADVAALLRRALVEVLLPRRDFLRIVLAEAIRRPEALAPVLAAADAALDDTLGRLGLSGGADLARVKRQFFTFGLLPALYSVALAGAEGVEALAADLAVWELAFLRGLATGEEGNDG